MELVFLGLCFIFFSVFFFSGCFLLIPSHDGKSKFGDNIQYVLVFVHSSDSFYVLSHCPT